jgi:glycine/D-amino acid oxidase-like deaminating enzyme
MDTPALRSGQPVWLRPGSRPPAIRYPALRGHHHADVAIVGAGMTGAMIAEAFARAGTRVAVVEAVQAGCGSTAASTALLLQEPDYDLGALARLHGTAAARRMWQLSHQATRQFIGTIRRLGIECDLRERESIYYTLEEAQVARLKRELQRRQVAGFRGRWLDADGVRRAAGIHGAAGISTTGNAQLDPVRAHRGLLAAAARSGADVFERSTVRRIGRVGGGVRLYTAGGTVDAHQVIIATGYATKYFRPLAGRFKMRHTYVLATQPIPWRVRQRVGLGPVMLWDTERPYHYVRWTRDHRLMFGGEDRPVKPGARRSAQFAAAARELREYFDRLFPALADVGIAHAWEGLFAMTPDGMPYLGSHRRYPGHAFALGYGGNGMTFAALAARILLEQWRGIASPDHALFAFSR